MRSPTPSRPPTRRCTCCTGRGKEGLGAAYLAGFGWALDAGYDAVVEMDADGSHRPEQLPTLLAAAEHADVVIGSRWVPRRLGGQLAAAPQGALGRRQPLHQGAARDAGQRRHGAATGSTAADALRAMGLDDVASQGYCFQIDLTWRAVKAGLTVVEVPITFVEREVGDSKMSRDIMTRVAAPDHRLGPAPPRPPGPRAGRRHPEPRWHRL